MQSVLRYVKGIPDLLRLRNNTSRLPLGIATSPTTRAPLYQRIPPWWARWTYALIACDIFMTFVDILHFIYDSRHLI